MPLINALRNPGLTDNHWREISTTYTKSKETWDKVRVEEINLTQLIQ